MFRNNHVRIAKIKLPRKRAIGVPTYFTAATIVIVNNRRHILSLRWTDDQQLTSAYRRKCNRV
jgi:hypothetical protein